MKKRAPIKTSVETVKAMKQASSGKDSKSVKSVYGLPADLDNEVAEKHEALFSRACHDNPELSPKAVREILKAKAEAERGEVEPYTPMDGSLSVDDSDIS